MSRNQERVVDQETLPGGGCLWSNLGNKRGIGKLEKKWDSNSRL